MVGWYLLGAGGPVIIDDRDGDANVFQAASADSRNGAIVQTSHGGCHITATERGRVWNGKRCGLSERGRVWNGAPEFLRDSFPASVRAAGTHLYELSR